MPKVVYSRTLERADWNATVVADVVPAEVLTLKAQPGGDLVLGGADLASEFARHDLIDEYRLYVHPMRDRAWHVDAPAVGREGPVGADRDAHFRQRGRHVAVRAASSGARRRVILVGPLVAQAHILLRSHPDQGCPYARAATSGRSRTAVRRRSRIQLMLVD